MMSATLQLLDPRAIIVGDRLRKLLPNRVEALRPSIRENGVQQPIEAVETDEGPRLIYGAVRLAAAIAEDLAVIPTLVFPKGQFGSEHAIRAREIAENIFDWPLTALERAVYIAEWRVAHEALHPPARPGPKPKTDADAELMELSANFALNFTDVVQETLGLSRRSVYLALKVARIEVAVRDAIAAHRLADNQQELLALAAEPTGRQAQIAELIIADIAGSVAEAIAVLDQTPAPTVRAAWERVSDTFSRLKPAEQENFFSLHEDAFRAYLARKGA